MSRGFVSYLGRLAREDSRAVRENRGDIEHPEDESRAVGEHHGKHDDEENVARLEEYKKLIDMKVSLRQSNLNPERPDLVFLRTLDSSIKRNTALIKKLKQINEEQREGLIEEIRNVNLSRFVSEAVAAICEAKLKSSDIQAAVQVCSLLHQRYKDFSPCLIQGLLKVFSSGKSGDDLEADKSLKAMKKRSTLKLLIELYFVGVVEDASIFVNIVKDLTSLENLKDRDATQTNLSLLASFARQGRFFLGLHQTGQEVDEFYKGLNVTAEQKKQFKKALHSYYDAISELLQSEHTSMRLVELENSKMLNARGELNEENVTAYEKLRKSYDHLFRGVSSLAEALDTQPPVMPDDGHTTRVTTGSDAQSSASGKESVPEPIWDDDDTRAFYESLPDLRFRCELAFETNFPCPYPACELGCILMCFMAVLNHSVVYLSWPCRAFVPAVLLGEAEPKLNEQVQKTQEQQSENTIEPENVQDSAEVCVDSEPSQDGKADDKSKDEEKYTEKCKDSEKEKHKSKEVERKGEEKDKLKALDGASLDALLQRLPGCVSRDLIDQLTVEFCYMNSKANRKKLVRALFNAPRTSLELLPYYSRMVATLSTCMKDVPAILVSMLEEEFSFLINKKDQTNIETKIKNIRFIGELCKFRIASATLVFNCLKACLDDFNHHNIDVACNLLETCGRFLYRAPETSIRMANMLEILMRLKNVKNLDPRHSTLVENAYYLCKPPERSARITKYIRKLLFSDLDKSSVEHVLRQLRKLPWKECEEYILRCFMKVHKGKYSQVHLIALLTAGLSRYHNEFAVAVVDEVLEEIRLGLELNDYNMQQRRIAYMRFLGELYNYEHIDSSVIFETLYLILVFGHDSPEDMFAELRPNMPRYSSIEEVNMAIKELEEHERDKASNERHSDGESRNASSKSGTSIIAANGARGSANGVEENGQGHEDAAESDSYSDSGSIEHEGHDDDEEPLYEDKTDDGSDGDDDEDDDGGPDGSDEDDSIQVRQKVVEVDPKEAEDFDRDLRALMQESVESRRLEIRARPTLNMMIPMNVFDGTKDPRAIDGESSEETVDEDGGTSALSNKVRVKVLMKKGNKQQTKHMFIPRESSLIQSTKQQEAAELEEKQNIKRKILEYNEREEEEMNGLSSQSSNWMPGSSGSGNAGSSGGRPSGRVNWEATGKTVVRQQRQHSSSGFYYGYGRRR
ncbi:Regulator of nonsense transcripts UPF2 [Apostasia shenzhenica]|uniref:Regulator of nonsense transcripts UPF2 n=1 Tax=Apostasia shenzhenica TaxID=1088818 RepID=A0A2I0AIW7_9ASPA|nr:Regulator of nonsense transcripts UPF2 [Apostasia shenzhenica]